MEQHVLDYIDYLLDLVEHGHPWRYWTDKQVELLEPFGYTFHKDGTCEEGKQVRIPF